MLLKQTTGSQKSFNHNREILLRKIVRKYANENN